VSQTEGPWYKEFWLWFILTPLFIVFIAGFNMLYLAIVTNDGVVVDNFYKDGKGIIVRHEEDTSARDRKLRANLHWANDHLTVQLSGNLVPLPEVLELLIIFPTAQAHDVIVKLAHQGLGEYRGSLNSDIKGYRQLQLQPIDSNINWRLHAQGAVPPLSSYLVLNPKQE